MRIVDCGLWIVVGQAAIHSPQSTVLESPMPQRDEVAFAAFAPLPKTFGEKDRQRLAVAVATLADGSAEYSRRTIFTLTEGRTVQARLLPDGVLIRFVVPKTSVRSGVALMEGLVRRPALPPESLTAALRRLQRGEADVWTASLHPQRNELRTITPEEARAVLARVFRPATTVVAAAGGFASGEVADGWATRTVDWKPTPEPRFPDLSVPREPADNPAGLTLVELRGRPFAASDPALPTRWLAALALGVGKGAALFRDVRQTEGWSYRQEAILDPDRDGLVTRLVAATLPGESDATRADGLRTTLLEAIDAWTESDRTRALGAAQLGLGPLILGDDPPGDGLLDRAALDAYWFAKAGARWDMDRLIAAMRNVPLETLKSEGTTMVRDARAIVLPGRAH